MITIMNYINVRREICRANGERDENACNSREQRRATPREQPRLSGSLRLRLYHPALRTNRC